MEVVVKSTRSDVYHRKWCPHVAAIINPIYLDMDDEILENLQPCKYCCSLDRLYKRYEKDHQIFMRNFPVKTEYKDPYLFIHTQTTNWLIFLNTGTQCFEAYRERIDPLIHKKEWMEYEKMPKIRKIGDLMVFLKDQECKAAYTEPYREQGNKIKNFASKYGVQTLFSGNDLYLVTDLSSWQIHYDEKRNRYLLYHHNLGKKKIQVKQAPELKYHVQSDICGVSGYQSPYVYLKYAYNHDKAKKIEMTDYKNLPHSTNKAKKYYKQAKNRAIKKDIRNVMNIFKQLEKEEGMIQYSFC